MEPASTKTHHARSSSLPSVQHPLIAHFNELLSGITSSGSESLTSLRDSLSKLVNLHECVESLLLMPKNQQALGSQCSEKEVDLLLNESLRILDMCGATKDFLSHAKESVNEIRSLLRRKISGTPLLKEVKAYLNKRKMTKRLTQKVLRNSKDAQRINSNDETLVFMTGMFREVETATVAVLESLLSFISGSNDQTSSRKWSLVSMLINSKKASFEDVSTINEFNKVDATLQSLVNQGMNKLVQSENAQTSLEHLELAIQDLEQGIESLFRKLIKTRVALLNNLNP